MINQYDKYWIKRPKETHEYKIGTYHVSQIGNSHIDLESSEHSGPCLRQGYWQYSDPIEFTDGTKGNFHMGRILHERIQEIKKINDPAVINEFPLRMWIKDIIISGSIDTIIFTKEGISIIDFKSASQYTLPSGKWDKNITHFSQVYLYAYILSLVFGSDINIKDVSLIYISKHNLATYVQTEKYDSEKAEGIFKDFLERCFYLDECLKQKQVPVPEPMKWCKYCDYRERCVKQGDVELVTTKKGTIRGLKVKNNEL